MTIELALWLILAGIIVALLLVLIGAYCQIKSNSGKNESDFISYRLRRSK